MRQRKVPAEASDWLQPQRKATAATTSDDGKDDETKPMSLADEIRARTAGRHHSSSSSASGGGLMGPSSPYSIFGRADYVIFFLLFCALYFAVKIEYKVDLLQLLWSHYLRPDYDEDDGSDG